MLFFYYLGKMLEGNHEPFRNYTFQKDLEMRRMLAERRHALEDSGRANRSSVSVEKARSRERSSQG